MFIKTLKPELSSNWRLTQCETSHNPNGSSWVIPTDGCLFHCLQWHLWTLNYAEAQIHLMKSWSTFSSCLNLNIENTLTYDSLDLVFSLVIWDLYTIGKSPACSGYLDQEFWYCSKEWDKFRKCWVKRGLPVLLTVYLQEFPGFWQETGIAVCSIAYGYTTAELNLNAMPWDLSMVTRLLSYTLQSSQRRKQGPLKECGWDKRRCCYLPFLCHARRKGTSNLSKRKKGGGGWSFCSSCYVVRV